MRALVGLVAISAHGGAAVAGTGPDSFDAFGRGDADCSTVHSAADLVATTRGIAGATVCGNDDCDRDGDLGDADADCAARCLFGGCPVAPNAPAVVEVFPETAPQIQSFSTIRIRGVRFGSGGRLKSVSIGGELAEVVEFLEPDEILAVVPEQIPGLHDVVVRDGELESTPFPILIEPPDPVGPLDTFDDLISLIDDVVTALADLEMDDVHEDDLAVFRREVDDFRADLPGLVDDLFAAAELPAQLRLRLDLAVDLSGTPEALRDALAQIQAFGRPAGSRGVAGPVLGATVQAAARSVGTGARTVIAVAQTGAAIALGTKILVVAGSAVVVAGAIGAGESILVDVPFIDEVPAYLRPGEEMTIVGRGFRTVPPNPDLVILTRFGEVTVRAARSGTTGDGRQTLVYEMPSAAGLCGADLEMHLARTVLLLPRRSPPVPAKVQPVLLEVGESEVRLGNRLSLTARGVVGCESRHQTFAAFRRASSGAPFAFGSELLAVPEPIHVDALPPSGFIPDIYDVSVAVDDIESEERLGIVLRTDLTSLAIECFDAVIAVGQTTLCEARPVPDTALLPIPPYAEFAWRRSLESSEPFQHLAIQSNSGETISLVGVSLGTETIAVRLETDRQAFVAQSGFDTPTIRVIDRKSPTVAITSSAPEIFAPPRDLRITVRADDDVGVESIVLRTTSDAVEPGARLQSRACAGSAMCIRTFDVPVLGSGFSSTELVFEATATDTSGNEGTATLRHRLRLTVLGGTIRNADDSSPLEGADVRLLNDERHFLVGARSDAEGHFVVMDPGEAAILSVVLEGFLPGEIDLAGSGGGAGPAPPLDIDIALVPISGVVGALTGTARESNQFGPVVPGTSVTVIDREGRTAGFDVSDSNGAYAITGLPVDDYLVFGDSPGKVRVSGHVQVSRFGTELVIPLQIPNPACRLDPTLFEPLRGYSASGRQTSFGQATFEDPFVTGIQDPAASFLCLSGSQATPVIGWDDITSRREIRRLIVREAADGGEILFDVVARPGEVLRAPVTFGDYSVGVPNGPEPTGILRPEVTYNVIISGTGGLSALLLQFRLR